METQDAGRSVSVGAVTEVLAAGQYRFACVNKGNESQWLACRSDDIRVGDTVAFDGGTLMKDFSSPSLGRTFPLVLFVDHIEVKHRPETQVRQVAGLPSGHPAVPESSRTSSGKPVLPDAKSLKAPEGTFSIREVLEQRTALAGKPIAVIGMVSKVNGNIMNRNWVHLVDEAGRELIVTTAAEVSLGSIQVAKGQFVNGKTFQTGYFVPALLEDAQLRSGS